jgi:DNA-binding PadR family transcriptional regulator
VFDSRYAWATLRARPPTYLAASENPLDSPLARPRPFSFIVVACSRRAPGTRSLTDVSEADITSTVTSAPLTPAVFHVLLALSGGERHGYAIMLDSRELSAGAVRMGPGTLYGTIKRLLDAGWIEESGERPDPALDDERRRYYRLTPAGAARLQTETARLASLVSTAKTRLPGRLAPQNR